MKSSSRGFTLVELMIVIAIIGVLAAALFPSMTGYLKRSRDTARASHLKDISNGLGAYFADQERYPSRSANYCFGTDTVSFSGNDAYLPKRLPTDPQASRPTGVNGCNDGRNYGYNTGTVNNSVSYQLTATFENDNGGNTGTAIATVISRSTYAADFGASRGSGSGYIVGN